MKLLKLTATFGCLDQATLSFDQGMTLIGAPNGSGKSTWCAFLRAMLYGLDTRQRDKKGEPAEKNRYRPWSGAPMEGLLLCEHQGRTIELRRGSAGGVPLGDFAATDLSTGQPVEELTAENAGEVLTGMSREVFDRSVFLRHTGLEVNQSQELEKRITALVAAGEEDVSWSEADERLKAWQRRLRFHKTGLLPQLEQEEARLRQTQGETGTLRQDLSRAQGRAAELRREKEKWDSQLDAETDQHRAKNRQRYDEATAELDAAERTVRALEARRQLREEEDTAEDLAEDLQDVRYDLRSRKGLMTVFLLVVILLTAVIALLYVYPRYEIPWLSERLVMDVPEFPLIFHLAAGGILWVLVLFFSLGKALADRKDRKEAARLQEHVTEARVRQTDQDRELEAALRHREQARKYLDAVSQQRGVPYLPPEAERCREELHLVEQEAARLQGQLSALGDPAAVDAQLDNVLERTAALEEDYAALELAMEVLRQADGQLHARVSPQLSQGAAGYFSRLTGGKYESIVLTRDLQVSVRETGSMAEHPLALLSRGTQDLLYLALRLALADLVLPEPDACPLILDDALLTFDQERLTLVLDCLWELSPERQVILFTCQRRELEYLSEREGVTLLEMPGF